MDKSHFPRLGLLWQFARPHRWTLMLGLVLGLLASGLGLATPLVTQRLLQSLEGATRLQEPLLLLVGLLVAGTVLSWYQWVVLGTLAEDVVLEARESMVRRFLRAKFLPLSQRPSGDLVTRVTSDSVLLRESTSSSLVGIINSLVMLVGTLVLMAVLDVTLMATTLLAIGVVAVVTALLVPAVSLHQQRAQAALADVGASLVGTLRAMKTVKAARAEQRQTDLLIERARQSRDHSVKAVRRESLMLSISWAGVQGATITVLGVGAWRVAEGAMSVPTLIAFLLYVFGLLGPVMELSESVTNLQSGVAAAGRIKEVETLEVEPTEASSGVHFPPSAAAPAIEIHRVTARYVPGGAPAATDVSLVVPARGHVAIVGPSGAGKTTIFSLILRFLEPETGHLRMRGVAYDDLGTAGVRENLAYVEQEAPTLPGTLRENITFATPEATEEQISNILALLHLDRMVASLPDGLDTELSDSSVSGGQRQRIALARALLANPAVLLLDEATAQVDSLSEAAIRNVVRERSRRSAVVSIAHRLSTVVDADTIIVMDEARVVAQGTHLDLLENSPLYRELVDALNIAA